VRGSGFYRLQLPQSSGGAAPADPRPGLTGLPTPVLIFRGSCDYLSWRSALDYRRLLPRAGLVYLDGAGAKRSAASSSIAGMATGCR